MKLILGSKSVGRKKILEAAGYTFRILTANIDEKAIRSTNFKELPLLLARAKAKKLLEHIDRNSMIITADQVVVYNGQLREKPETKEQAQTYLQSYNTKHPAQTYTAVVVTNTKTGKQAEIIDIAKVYFKKIPSHIIEKLIEEGSVMHAAGGFIVEHPLLAPFVDHIEGTLDSITGLPLQKTQKLIKEVTI